MELLEATVKAAGGVSALARHLGVKPNTVSNWQSRGLPHAYACLFRFMRQERSGLFAPDVTNVIDRERNIGTPAHESNGQLPAM